MIISTITLRRGNVKKNWAAAINERAAAKLMNVKVWIKRLGFWGLMFFLLKGLLWLTIPALLALLATE